MGNNSGTPNLEQIVILVFNLHHTYFDRFQGDDNYCPFEMFWIELAGICVNCATLSLPFKMFIKMAYIKHFKVPPNGAARFLIVSSFRVMPFFKWQGKNLS